MVSRRLIASVFGAAVLFSTALVTAQHDPNKPGAEGHAFVLEHLESRLGPQDLDLGLFGYFELGTSPAEWALFIQNVKLKFAGSPSQHISLGLGVDYARVDLSSLPVSQTNPDTQEKSSLPPLDFSSISAKVFITGRLDPFTGTLGVSYSRPLLTGDVQEEDLHFEGSLQGHFLSLAPRFEYRFSDHTALVIDGRILVMELADASGGTRTTWSPDGYEEPPRVLLDVYGRADIRWKLNIRGNGSAHAHWRWRHLNIKLGLGYGHVQVPVAGVFTTSPLPFPFFDIFWRL